MPEDASGPWRQPGQDIHPYGQDMGRTKADSVPAMPAQSTSRSAPALPVKVILFASALMFVALVGAEILRILRLGTRLWA